MKEYSDKNAFIDEIKRTADLFISEFEDISEADKDTRYDEVDRTPQEMIAYQLGWMGLLLAWDRNELATKEVVTPHVSYRWNQLGPLYQSFYDRYRNKSLSQLRKLFMNEVNVLTKWVDDFNDVELFKPGGRKWASSIKANWPIWKWVHINTVAPFSSFRTKIRKWKKIQRTK